MRKQCKYPGLVTGFGAVLLLFFLFLAFVIFPAVKQLLTLPNYVAAEELVAPREFKANVIFNDSLQDYPFSDLLIAHMRGAQKSIYAAVYSIDSVEIRDELYAAANRGIKVEIVLDYKKHIQHSKLFINPPKNLKIQELNTGNSTGNSYMHNKFTLFDIETEHASLLTGAWNWTILQEKIDPTFLMETSDPDILSIYIEEFERLYSGINSTKKFSDDKYKPFAKKILFDDCFVEIWFSPGIAKNSVNQRILDLIDSAQSNIKIMVWRITKPAIASALRNQSENGVKITIIVDDYNAKLNDSVFSKYKDVFNHKNIRIITDASRKIDTESLGFKDPAGLNSFLHHHMMIVDNKTVLFGTNNWSDRGSYKNDENIIVTDSESVVNAFKFSFENNFRALALTPDLSKPF